MKKAELIIEGQSSIFGKGIGASGIYTGELVFNTAMSGYPEALTDPSYVGQILLFSYPLIGNYGVSEEWFESTKFQPKAIICGELSEYYNHYQSSMSLEEFMQEQNAGGIIDVDTRFLVRLIRKHGVINAKIIVN